MYRHTITKSSEKRFKHLSDANSLELKILIENYHESRQEGIKLAHSVFNDVAFVIALLGGVIGGSVLTQSPGILLSLPLLLCGITLYMIQKFRINNLITSYLIYLENELNVRLKKPLFIWNSRIINSHISANRSSTWGNILLVLLIVVFSMVYLCFVFIPYMINSDYFLAHTTMIIIYWVSNGLLYIICIFGLISALRVTKKLNPSKIGALIQDIDPNGDKVDA